jgi:membrane fusion protein (multidrug efflux system)
VLRPAGRLTRRRGVHAFVEANPMKISRRLIGAAVVVVLLSALGAGVYWRINGAKAGQEGTAQSQQPRGDLPAVSATETFTTDIALAVEGSEVVRDTLVIAVTAAGQAASPQQTALRAQVSGQVRAVRVGENQAVGSGAAVIELDPTEYRLALDEAQARLREAEARYREITLGDDRIDDAQVRAERDSIARARSGLEAARVAIRRAEINLARTRVVAPFAGRIANLKVVVGQHVNAGEELLTVQAMDPIRVEAKVLEGEIAHIARGRTARLKFVAFPDEVFEGRIESINPVVDQQTGHARVSVIVRNPGGRIMPGMHANVSLDARRFPDRIMVPRSAILERDKRTMLFVYEESGSNGLAKWRYVNPGLMNDTHVEILAEGPETGMVEPGEIVLTAGHYSLTHDARVRIVQSAAAEGGRPR